MHSFLPLSFENKEERKGEAREKQGKRKGEAREKEGKRKRKRRKEKGVSQRFECVWFFNDTHILESKKTKSLVYLGILLKPDVVTMVTSLARTVHQHMQSIEFSKSSKQAIICPTY